MLLSQLFTLAIVAGAASAHGSADDIQQEAEERRRFLQVHTNNLDHCGEIHQTDRLHERAIRRRAEVVASLQQTAVLEGKRTSKRSSSLIRQTLTLRERATSLHHWQITQFEPTLQRIHCSKRGLWRQERLCAKSGDNGRPVL
jgi:hypothetical protein